MSRRNEAASGMCPTRRSNAPGVRRRAGPSYAAASLPDPGDAIAFSRTGGASLRRRVSANVAVNAAAATSSAARPASAPISEDLRSEQALPLPALRPQQVHGQLDAVLLEAVREVRLQTCGRQRPR